MTVDEISKLIFILAISFGVAGISYQLMRLIGAVADNVKDLRTTVQNFGTLSTKLTNDYDFVSQQVKGFAGSIGSIGKNVIDPVVNIFGFLKRFKSPKQADSDHQKL